MDTELTEKLIKNHPTIFKCDTEKMPFAMFYFECDNGWFHLLNELATKIEQILAEKPNQDIQISQVKEKFGTLRFYFYAMNCDDYIFDKINQKVKETEEESGHICEYCGETNSTLHSTGCWIYNRCNKCWAECCEKNNIALEEVF
jgi:hypothetical protein